MDDPTRDLWVRILMDSAEDLIKNKKKFKRASYAWIFSDNRREFNSFLNICNQLGYDGHKMREAIRERIA